MKRIDYVSLVKAFDTRNIAREYPIWLMGIYGYNYGHAVESV